MSDRRGDSALSLLIFFFCFEVLHDVRLSSKVRGGQSRRGFGLVWTFGAPSNRLGRDPTVIVAGMGIRRLAKLFGGVQERRGEI